MNHFVQASVMIFLYCLLMLGWVLLWLPDLKTAVHVIRSRKRLSANRVHHPQGALDCHLYHAMAVAWNRQVSPKAFYAGSSWLAVLVFIFSVRALPISTAAVSALAAGAAPYGFLRLKAEMMRRKGSHEGEQLISEFLRQYRIHRFNVYETMEILVTDAQASGPVSRKLMYQTLTMLRNASSDTGIKGAVDVFSEGIGTHWSRMLAKNIRLAAERGTNVSSALEDLLIQLRQARELHEERNRMNSEAARMTLFMVPLLYIATLFLASGYMEIAPGRLYGNQMETAEGLSCFLAIWFLFAVNLAVTGLVNHQKLDF